VDDQNQKRQWAEEFKKDHKCTKCPFVKDEVDIGVGIQRNCDIVCSMSVDEIIEQMEGYCV
jgi:hypothetical protein